MQPWLAVRMCSVPLQGQPVGAALHEPCANDHFSTAGVSWSQRAAQYAPAALAGCAHALSASRRPACRCERFQTASERCEGAAQVTVRSGQLATQPDDSPGRQPTCMSGLVCTPFVMTGASRCEQVSCHLSCCRERPSPSQCAICPCLQHVKDWRAQPSIARRFVKHSSMTISPRAQAYCRRPCCQERALPSRCATHLL